MATLGYRAEIDAGRRFIESIEPDETISILFHGDADGCCAAAILNRTLLFLGDELVFPIFLMKGETIYSESVNDRIRARDPSYLLVADAGSRSRPIMPELTTMVIDHHRPEGIPPVDVFLTSYSVEPAAPTSLLCYEVCRELVRPNTLEWLAAVGTAADLGSNIDYEIVRNARNRYGAQAIDEVVALLNAARRSASVDIGTAFTALMEADSPTDIAELAIPEAVVLDSYREEVNAEFARVMQIPPIVHDQWALIKFRSSDLIHPLVSLAWQQRLQESNIIAANYGYTPGNVHFSTRSSSGQDLLAEWSRSRPIMAENEYIHGHTLASGGYMELGEFKRFLEALGFPDEVAQFEP